MSDRPVALVLRHDPSERQATADSLRSCGFEAIEAATVESGLCLIAERSVDVALCDAESVDAGARPVWQRLLAATVRREAIVVLLGQTNSHQEMLAACPGSRLVVCPSRCDREASARAREILSREGLVATLHRSEALDAPRFAERRQFATADAAAS